MSKIWREHSLSLIAGSIFLVWVLLYIGSDPNSHIGSFFGNAIADWSGVILMVLATKFLYERGSSESRSPPDDVPDHRLYDFFRDHSLTLFLGVTLIGWIIVYGHSDVNSKWGQVVGNVVSEWTQAIGMVLLTKRFIERHSKESGD